MASNEKKIMGRRLRNSYISSVISISLVLLLVGIASLLLVSAGSVSDYFRRNLQVSVMMKVSVDDSTSVLLAEHMRTMPAVEGVKCVSKAQGTEELKSLLGENFLSVFDASPIPASIDVTLKPEYVSADSVALFKSQVLDFPEVAEVVYQESLITALNDNIARISTFLGVFIALLLVISYALINNTVRLSLFSNRFTIHTMKLVGATRHFIRSPFIWRSVLLGLLSAILALGILGGGLYFLKGQFEQLFSVFTTSHFVAVAAIVAASGVLICVASTWIVVSRMLSLSKDELYY